ncbi:helix-turn-helix domain-containing protein [Haliangium ochraceum]|uniref:Transcriptional regulator, XRE family n=1 Tax=Haliangium ochraceum (strain DSM 14365 / JCM 11303 / SMP-2) TaxID=502025 RepID=D0LLJ1_HALO1|nr:helix-turn-helix transcriptional regulator [Haliangium ochraceum]ACY13208.1 transcriptional regulator, XRE family [Haliangium ochraceum DSM 14365]
MSRELATTIGNAVRDGRKAFGLTQEQAAERLDICVDYYGRVERGIAIPSVSMLRRLAVAFGLDGNVLLGLSDADLDTSA